MFVFPDRNPTDMHMNMCCLFLYDKSMWWRNRHMMSCFGWSNIMTLHSVMITHSFDWRHTWKHYMFYEWSFCFLTSRTFCHDDWNWFTHHKKNIRHLSLSLILSMTNVTPTHVCILHWFTSTSQQFNIASDVLEVSIQLVFH